MPPVAITVAVPAATARRGAVPGVRISALRRSLRGVSSLAPSVSAARDAGDDVAGQRAAERIGQRNGLLAERREAKMTPEPRLRLVAADDFEKLLLARRPAHRRLQRLPLDRLRPPVHH
jgi:hypothetical protein